MMYRYLLAYGSNLGDKENNLQRAVESMNAVRQCVRRSQWITTQPLAVPSLYQSDDMPEHGEYLNFVEDVRSRFSPVDLYQKIVQVEDHIGHCRVQRWSPRQLDIDIVLWGRDDADFLKNCQPLQMKTPLQIPHPGWSGRDFLRELAREIQAVEF